MSLRSALSEIFSAIAGDANITHAASTTPGNPERKNVGPIIESSFVFPKRARPSTLLCRGTLRLHQPIVVALGASRVSHGERRQRIVHGVVFSHISREHRWICRARMGACERAPAQMRKAGQRPLFHQLADRSETPVLQLAHVEISPRRVVLRPTEEDVAR